jgi:uncharacterized membrane protein YraQ (UPF0718 family)
MFDHIISITQFILDAFLHIWPYLLVTIPLAVLVQISGASKYINRAFMAKPIVAIFLATFVGAFSPFCSCGVIPVIAALLLGGVPLAPVMSFWVASPSMDPEIFFLSVGTLGWELAIWRLASTLVLSLGAGFVTHYVIQKGWLKGNLLKNQRTTTPRSSWELLKTGWKSLKQNLQQSLNRFPVQGFASASVGTTQTTAYPEPDMANSCTSYQISSEGVLPPPSLSPAPGTLKAEDSCDADTSSCSSSCQSEPVPFRKRLLQETWKATTMVVKFMGLAFLLEALISLYIPSEWITGLLGGQNPLAIITAALMGVPVYASNLSALPMISGLLEQGMQPAAALAFLISGPITTLPAMAAVWGIVQRRVFLLYIGFALVGAVMLGYVYAFVGG